MFNIPKYILALVLGILSIPAYSAGCDGKVLSWTPPTTNTDGTRLTDLTSYTLVYGRSPGKLLGVRSGITRTTTRWCIKKSSPKPYYAAVRAVNSKGVSSTNSNIVKVY